MKYTPASIVDSNLLFTIPIYQRLFEWDEENSTYTLQVRHNGPVDITLTCSGTDTEGKTDIPEEIVALTDLPKQPADYNGEIIIEAEDMDFKNIKSCVTDPYGWYPSVRGHAGNGFMDMGTNTAGSLRHYSKIKHPGDYKIAVRYTCTQRAGNLVVLVNGTRYTVPCEKTAVNEWRKAYLETTLNEGKNTLIINNTSGLNMYIDNITYIPAGVEAEKFNITIRNAEHGTAVASVNEAAEGEKVSIEVTPDEGYALAGWSVVHGDVIIGEDNTFIMPDDNVTLQPIFTDLSATYTLDFSNVLSGTIPEGWRATQENNEVHEYPSSFSSGARTFSGFTGYQGKGLYWRVNNAEYGRQAAYPLVLQPGAYKLTFAMAAWKESPKYKARMLDKSGKVIAESPVYSATPNANGNTSANLSSAQVQELSFTVTTPGQYIISFVNNGTGFDEFLLLECRINTVIPDGIFSLATDDEEQMQTPIAIYSPSGVKRDAMQKGLNIIVTPSGKTKKIIIKD